MFFWRKCSLFSLWCPTTTRPQLWFTEVPESNMQAACRLKLQLQQRVAVGDSFAKLEAADRQISRRTSEGKPENILSVKYSPVFLKLLFYCDINVWSELHIVPLWLISDTRKHKMTSVFNVIGLSIHLHPCTSENHTRNPHKLRPCQKIWCLDETQLCLAGFF